MLSLWLVQSLVSNDGTPVCLWCLLRVAPHGTMVYGASSSAVTLEGTLIRDVVITLALTFFQVLSILICALAHLFQLCACLITFFVLYTAYLKCSQKSPGYIPAGRVALCTCRMLSFNYDQCELQRHWPSPARSFFDQWFKVRDAL